MSEETKTGNEETSSKVDDTELAQLKQRTEAAEAKAQKVEEMARTMGYGSVDEFIEDAAAAILDVDVEKARASKPPEKKPPDNRPAPKVDDGLGRLVGSVFESTQWMEFLMTKPEAERVELAKKRDEFEAALRENHTLAYAHAKKTKNLFGAVEHIMRLNAPEKPDAEKAKAIADAKTAAEATAETKGGTAGTETVGQEKEVDRRRAIAPLTNPLIKK